MEDVDIPIPERPERQLRRWVPPMLPAGISPEALATVLVSTRAVFAATTAQDIVDAVVAAVRALGGEVSPAWTDPSDAMPIDLGLGEVGPLLAVAPAVSVARMHLETLLPALVEDGRTAMHRLRNSGRLSDEASLDVLTGLLNRRALFRRLARLTTGDAVVLLDLDHFKALNDTRGHEAGDDALAAFGALLRSWTRASDVVGRYGGEEFLIGMVRATPCEAAVRVAELRRHWLATEPLVTFSAGIAAVGDPGPRIALPIADRALYRAKAAGRDRWEVAGADGQ